VFGVPTVAVGEELFWGDDRLEDAAACVLSVGPAA
jgi:2-hydroxychromene-2-carboxylate isomerase